MIDFICMDSDELFGTGREQNENICLQRDSNPHPNAPITTTCKSALSTARPRRLADDLWFNVLQESGIQINKIKRKRSDSVL